MTVQTNSKNLASSTNHFVILVLFLVASRTCAEEIRSNVTIGQTRDVSLILPPSQRSKAQMRERAIRFVADCKRERILLGRLVMAPDAPSLDKLFGRLVYMPNYDEALNEINSLGRSPESLPMARVLVVGPNAGVVFREADGLSYEQLSGTADPSLFREGSGTLSLLTFRARKGGQASTVPNDATLTAYFRSNSEAVSEVHSKMAMEALSRYSKIVKVNVRVRADPWFLDDGEYALVMPFIDLPAFLSREDYKNRPIVVCLNWPNGGGCSIGKPSR